MLLSGVSYPAGHQVTAAEFNSLVTAINDMTTYVEKTVDETVTSSASLQDDDELQASLSVANAVYDVYGNIIFGAGGLASVNGFKYTFTGPTGTTLNWVPHVKTDTDGTNAATSIWQTGLSIGQTVQAGGAGGVAITMTAAPRGLLKVGSTTGTFKLRWSQATSNGTGTKVYAGSFLHLRRVA